MIHFSYWRMNNKNYWTRNILRVTYKQRSGLRSVIEYDTVWPS
jgi:hypothetical protein